MGLKRSAQHYRVSTTNWKDSFKTGHFSFTVGGACAHCHFYLFYLCINNFIVIRMRCDQYL